MVTININKYDVSFSGHMDAIHVSCNNIFEYGWYYFLLCNEKKEMDKQ